MIYGAKEGLNRLMDGHRKLWNELWEGDIMIEGDDEAQRAVRFALYNLYSNARKGSRLSISPFCPRIQWAYFLGYRVLDVSAYAFHESGHCKDNDGLPYGQTGSCLSESIELWV